MWCARTEAGEQSRLAVVRFAVGSEDVYELIKVSNHS